METKVFAAMSGGVDSAVAALLVKERGFSVSGVHLRLIHNEDLGAGQESGCCSQADAEDAGAVARRLGIPFYVFDEAEEFRATVVRRFIDGYAAGETPNPCMDCNRFLKWGALLRRAELLGCQYIATGHYARVRQDPETGRWLLLSGVDAAKDQSYFLSHLTQEQLAHTLLPLGELTKPQVRELALAHGFVNARKRDSQDLCFAPDGDYGAFIQRMTGKAPEPGPIEDEQGRRLGTHSGLIHYTIGQRKGLGIAAEQPLYVCGKDTERNVLVVGPAQTLLRRTLTAREVNWIAQERLEEPCRARAQIRYRQIPQPAVVTPLPDGRIRVDFDEPQRAVTPGQTLVVRSGEQVLGAGVIE